MSVCIDGESRRLPNQRNGDAGLAESMSFTSNRCSVGGNVGHESSFATLIRLLADPFSERKVDFLVRLSSRNLNGDSNAKTSSEGRI